jgi:hypothetical protein
MAAQQRRDRIRSRRSSAEQRIPHHLAASPVPSHGARLLQGFERWPNGARWQRCLGPIEAPLQPIPCPSINPSMPLAPWLRSSPSASCPSGSCTTEALRPPATSCGCTYAFRSSMAACPALSPSRAIRRCFMPWRCSPFPWAWRTSCCAVVPLQRHTSERVRAAVNKAVAHSMGLGNTVHGRGRHDLSGSLQET